MKTQTELQKLKSNWLNDPCWDIETTEGFEEHWDELFKFRKHHEARCQQYSLKETYDYAAEIGIPENLILARHIKLLEERIDQLQRSINSHPY